MLTIATRTYLAKRRLAKALSQLPASSPVNFTIKYFPYQLYPEATRAGEDKFDWYKKSRYGDSDEKMRMYTALMGAYGKAEGIEYKFGGTVANTLQAHRVVWWFQKEENGGAKVAERIVAALYRQYFEEERHPSSTETLMKAVLEAGVEEKEARRVVEDEELGLRDVEAVIREQKGNGIDAVPYIVIEGKRRDVTIEGCREVEEYVKNLERVIKESN